jgi:hypothetical protein
MGAKARLHSGEFTWDAAAARIRATLLP